MREKKFKVWDKETERMFYDRNGITLLELLNDADTCDDEFWLLNTKYVIRDYTGLEDLHDKEIYEGDIVYVAGSGNCVVKWDKALAGWVFDNGSGGEDYQEVLEDLERIIGNIYENPELI